MSVLIRGMEMPKDGESVVLVISNENGKTLAEVDEYCGAVYEAVPVPPHGDLIDRDDLYRSIGGNGKCNGCPNDAYKCQFYREYCLMDFCERIEDAPTIIPAGPKEEGE